MKTLIVVPTYNEAENISSFLSAVRSALPSADILVVDDSSPDGTAQLARDVADELGNIQVFVRPNKSGLGRAYRAGFNIGIANGYEIIIEMDADFSHDPKSLGALIAPIVSGDADLVIGSRYVPGGKVPGWPALRRAISKGGNLYARTMLGLPIRDVTAGYRAYRAELLSQLDLDAISADGYGFQVEMAWLSFKAHARIVEVPITFVDRTAGTSKMSTSIVVEALFLVTWWAFRERVIVPIVRAIRARKFCKLRHKCAPVGE